MNKISVLMITSKVKNIFYFTEEGHYGLNIIFDFEINVCLHFDSSHFRVKSKENLKVSSQWKKLEYEELNNNISIAAIKEDELAAYFVQFTNDDILYIHQVIDGMEEWYFDLELVSKIDSFKYASVIGHMNENWIKDVKL